MFGDVYSNTVSKGTKKTSKYRVLRFFYRFTKKINVIF